MNKFSKCIKIQMLILIIIYHLKEHKLSKIDEINHLLRKMGNNKIFKLMFILKFIYLKIYCLNIYLEERDWFTHSSFDVKTFDIIPSFFK